MIMLVWIFSTKTRQGTHSSCIKSKKLFTIQLSSWVYNKCAPFLLILSWNKDRNSRQLRFHTPFYVVCHLIINSPVVTFGSHKWPINSIIAGITDFTVYITQSSNPITRSHDVFTQRMTITEGKWLAGLINGWFYTRILHKSFIYKVLGTLNWVHSNFGLKIAQLPWPIRQCSGT